MDPLSPVRQTVAEFLAAVKARKKRAAVAFATRELQTLIGDNAGWLFDCLRGCRVAPGRAVLIEDHALAEIWHNTTYYYSSGNKVFRDTLLVRLDREEGLWRISDVEVDNKRFAGKRHLRGQPDPGAPELPDAVSSWMAAHAAGRTSRRPDATQDVPGPFEGPVGAASEFRATMVRKQRKGLRVQARLSGHRHRTRWLWLTFEQRGERWVLTGWEDD